LIKNHLEQTSLEFYVTKFIYLNYYSSMSILTNMIYCYLSREVKGSIKSLII